MVSDDLWFDKMKNLIFAAGEILEKNFSLLHDFIKNKPEDSQFFIYEK